MKRWAENPWARPFTFVIAVLALAVSPLAILWHALWSKKAAVIGNDLVVGKERIVTGQIECLLIHAYWPAPAFALTLRGRRPVEIVPERTADLLAWIREAGVPVRIKGSREREFRRRLGLPDKP